MGYYDPNDSIEVMEGKLILLGAQVVYRERGWSNEGPVWQLLHSNTGMFFLDMQERLTTPPWCEHSQRDNLIRLALAALDRGEKIYVPKAA